MADDLHKIICYFETNGNKVTTGDLINKLGFTSFKIREMTLRGDLQHLDHGNYALSNQFYKKFRINLPQGTLRLDKQTFEFPFAVSRENAEKVIRAKIVQRANHDNLLIKKIIFDGNRYDVEFFPARYSPTNNHIVFDGIRTPENLINKARVYEGAGRWELGRYFRNLADNPSKNYHETVTAVISALKQRYGDIGRLDKLSEHHRGINPVKTSAETVHLKIEDVRLDPKTGTYLFGDKIQKLPEKEYRSAFAEISKSLGLNAKKFASMTFRRVLPAIGIGLSIETIAKAEDKIDATLEETTTTLGGLGGGLTSALLAAPTGPIGMAVFGVLGSVGGSLLAGSSYRAIREQSKPGTPSSNATTDYQDFSSTNSLFFNEALANEYRRKSSEEIANEQVRNKEKKETIIKEIRKIIAKKNKKVESGSIEESNESDFENATKLESLIENIEHPEMISMMLSAAEMENVKKIISGTEEQFNISFLEQFSSVVSDLNSVFDRNAFAQKYQQQYQGQRVTGSSQEMSPKNEVHDPIPILHTAFNIASFFNIKEATRISNTVSYSAQMLKGGAEILSVLSSKGLEGIFDIGVSFGSGNLLAGFTGLVSLFGKKENPNAQMIQMIQALSQQMAQMHNNILEILQMHSIALGIIDFHVIKGFEKIESILAFNHQELKTLFNQIKQFLYIDLLYLESFKQAFKENRKYHIIHLINNADWNDVLHRIKSEIEHNAESLSVGTFKKGIDDLSYILDKVQKNGIGRSSELLMDDTNNIDYSKLADSLTVSSEYITRQRPKSFSDNYRLYTEQNIHLFVKYLEMINKKYNLNISLPQLNELYNPAALYDIAATSHQLLEAYPKSGTSFGIFMGIPKEPVLPFLKTINKGIEGHEQLLQSLPLFFEKIFDEYLDDIITFSRQLKELQDHAALNYFSENILPKFNFRLNSNLQMLEGLDSNKASEFFLMDHPPYWFHFVWHSPYPGENRFSRCGFDDNCCHPKNDRPCREPKSDIQSTKKIYRETHHDRAQAIHQSLIKNQKKINENWLQQKFSEKNKDGLLRWISYVIFNDKSRFRSHDFSYYFMNNNIPLVVPAAQLEKIPEHIFQLVFWNYGQLKFTWEYNEQTRNLKLSATLESNEQLKRSDILFEGVTNSLPFINVKLSSIEAAHYIWYGGEVPSGESAEYDPDLRRFSDPFDIPALRAYEQRKVAADYYGCDLFRGIVWMPKTITTNGLFDSTLNDGTLKVNRTVLNNWNYTTNNINDQFNKRYQDILALKKKTIRKEIYGEIVRAFESGSFEHLKLPPTLNEILVRYNRINVNSIILKMIFGLSINPENMLQDSIFPNLFDAQDILRDLKKQFDSPIFLYKRLELLHFLLLGKKAAFLDKLKNVKNEQYPFVHFKDEFLKYINEIVMPKLMPNFIAESQPKNLNDLDALIRFFPRFSSAEQAKLLAMSPKIMDFVNPNQPLLAGPQVTNGNTHAPKIKVTTEKNTQNDEAEDSLGAESSKNIEQQTQMEKEKQAQSQGGTLFGLPIFANGEMLFDTSSETLRLNRGSNGQEKSEIVPEATSSASSKFDASIFAHVRDVIKLPISYLSSLSSKSRYKHRTRNNYGIRPLEPEQTPKNYNDPWPITVTNDVTGAKILPLSGNGFHELGKDESLIVVAPNTSATITGVSPQHTFAIPTSEYHDGKPKCQNTQYGSILTTNNTNIKIETDADCAEILPKVVPVPTFNGIGFAQAPFFHSSLMLHGLAFVSAFRQEISDKLLWHFSGKDQTRYDKWQKGVQEFREKDAVKLVSDLGDMAIRVVVSKDLQVTENTTHIAKDFMNAILATKKEPKNYFGILARAMDEATFLLDRAMPYVSISGITQVLTRTYDKYIATGSKAKAAESLIDNLPLLIPGSRVVLDTLDRQDKQLSSMPLSEASLESTIQADAEDSEEGTRIAVGLRRRTKTGCI